MKIIQITDIHLAPGASGSRQSDRLRHTVADVNARHSDADFCVITGDLSDDGSELSYLQLRECLAELVIPHHVIPGNHDNRDKLGAVLSGHCGQKSSDRFLQRSIKESGFRFVLLDTLDAGNQHGRLCRERLDWLAEILSSSAVPSFIFMHHPPADIGCPALDVLKLVNAEEFLERLQGKNVRHIFFGHVHRDVHGFVKNIPFSGQRGLHDRFSFSESGTSLVVDDGTPSYGVILISSDGNLAVHSIDIATGLSA